MSNDQCPMTDGRVDDWTLAPRVQLAARKLRIQMKGL
jgi:hypothetical protein